MWDKMWNLRKVKGQWHNNKCVECEHSLLAWDLSRASNHVRGWNIGIVTIILLVSV